MFETGLIHSTCIEQGKRPTSNMPDENFVQGENFCIPPNYFFIFTSFIIFGVIFKSLKWGFPGPDLFQTITVSTTKHRKGLSKVIGDCCLGGIVHAYNYSDWLWARRALCFGLVWTIALTVTVHNINFVRLLTSAFSWFTPFSCGHCHCPDRQVSCLRLLHVVLLKEFGEIQQRTSERQQVWLVSMECTESKFTGSLESYEDTMETEFIWRTRWFEIVIMFICDSLPLIKWSTKINFYIIFITLNICLNSFQMSTEEKTI